jgi:hypothetical protein
MGLNRRISKFCKGFGKIRRYRGAPRADPVYDGNYIPMNPNITTILVDAGVLLFLVAVSFGLWYCPWIRQW